MADQIFVKGVWLEEKEFDWGTIIKGSIDINGLYDFIKNECADYINTADNKKTYLNIEIKKAKSGKPYMAVDTWKPPKSDDSEPDCPF